MRNKALVILAFLFAGFTQQISATTAERPSTTFGGYGYGKFFTFEESNITFSVYKNGEFDFYLNAFADESSVYFRGNGVSISYNSGCDYDAFIQRDRFGAIIQIEDTPIFYDHFGRVTQIGNVDIHYRNNYLRRIGGLYINFNVGGRFLNCRGFINTYNPYYVYRPYYEYFRPIHYVYDYRIVRPRAYRRYYTPVRRSYLGNRTYAKVNNRRQATSRRTRISTPRRTGVTNNPRRTTRTRATDRTPRTRTRATTRGNAPSRTRTATSSTPRTRTTTRTRSRVDSNGNRSVRRSSSSTNRSRVAQRSARTSQRSTPRARTSNRSASRSQRNSGSRTRNSRRL